MTVVKVRKVGNSLTISLPRELGFSEGDEVDFIPLETGEVLIAPVERVRKLHAEVVNWLREERDD